MYRVVFSTMLNNYDLYKYSCHEGNGAIHHSLSGERDYERRVEQAIANGAPVPARTPGATNLNLPEGTELVYRDINAGE